MMGLKEAMAAAAAAAAAMKKAASVTYANLNLTGSGRHPRPKTGDGLDRIRKDIARSFVKRAHGRWNGWTHGPELSWDIMQPRLTTVFVKDEKGHDKEVPAPARDHKAERVERKRRWREGMANGFY